MVSKNKKKSHKSKGYHKPNPGNPILAAQKKKLTIEHVVREAEQKVAFDTQLNIFLQMAEDACLIATQEVRGLGPDNAQKLRSAFRRTINQMCGLIADDEDSEIVYSQAKIDERLAQIEGEDRARPWGERMTRRLVSLGVSE